MPEVRINAVPIAQPRQRVARIAGIARNYTPANAPIHTWKAAVQMAWQSEVASAPLDGPVWVELQFVMPRPKKLKLGQRVWFNRKPDIDNLIKSALDALNGMAWRDDSQVVHVHAVKQYASSEEQPHAIISVHSLEG